jgi:hypothetical protein
VYEWRTPHGYRFRVDASGTHPLGKDDTEQAGKHVRADQRASGGSDPVDLSRSPLERDLANLVIHGA